MKIENHHIIFDTGTYVHISRGIIGISITPGELGAFEGYEGQFYEPGRKYKGKPDLTSEECVELAEYMMDQWESFLVYHRKIANESVPPSTAY